VFTKLNKVYFLIILFGVLVAGCGVLMTGPTAPVKKFIKAAQDCSIKDMFMQFEGSLSDMENFENQYKKPPYRSAKAWGGISWTGSELPPEFYKVFFTPKSKFHILSTQTLRSEAEVIVEITYPISECPVFVYDFEYMEPTPTYEGIAPIFQDFFGRGPLGPYAPDDPMLTKGFDYHRRVLKLKTKPIKSVRIEFQLIKPEYGEKKKWMISQIIQPYKDSYPDQTKVNQASLGNFTFFNVKDANKISLEELEFFAGSKGVEIYKGRSIQMMDCPQIYGFSVSPKENKFLYTCVDTNEQRLYLYNIDTDTAYRFNAPDSMTMWVSFTNDGRSILCTSGNIKKREVHIISLDGTEHKQLTHTRYGTWYEPSLSPNCKTLYYVEIKDLESNFQAVVQDLVTGQRTIIAEDLDLTYGFFLPDNESIVYLVGQRTASGLKLGIHKYNLKTSTSTQVVEPDTGTELILAGISRDGRKIAYCAVIPGQSSKIHIKELDSEETYLIGDTARFNFSPAFSPDGDYVVFESGQKNGYGQQQIFIGKTNGKELKQISFGKGWHSNPLFLPNGKSVIYIYLGDDRREQGVLIRELNNKLPRDSLISSLVKMGQISPE